MIKSARAIVLRDNGEHFAGPLTVQFEITKGYGTLSTRWKGTFDVPDGDEVGDGTTQIHFNINGQLSTATIMSRWKVGTGTRLAFLGEGDPPYLP